MTHPFIGIPCRPDISSTYAGRPINAMSQTYINAVIQAGGLPVLIPLQVPGALLPELLQRVDGLIFSGGGDIDPACYGETPQVDNLDQIHPAQDELELKLMQLVTQRRKPFLAICRGYPGDERGQWRQSVARRRPPEASGHPPQLLSRRAPPPQLPGPRSQPGAIISAGPNFANRPFAGQ